MIPDPKQLTQELLVINSCFHGFSAWWWCLVVVRGAWWWLEVLGGGVWWWLEVLGGGWWCLVVLGGAWWWLEVLGGEHFLIFPECIN